jgi:ATP-dependent Clp protease ATP-binding subunit ClpA
MSIHRWQKEFEDALKLKNAVILSNNVRDKYLYLAPGTTEGYELLSLSEYIVKFLRQDFNIIKLYDPVDKITDCSPKKGTISTTEKPSGEFEAPSRSSAPAESTVDRDLVLIANELNAKDKCCFIMTFTDKTLPSKASSPDEQKLLLRIEKMIQNMKPSNKLILLYVSDDVITPDLYKNNPRVKTVCIPSPDRNDLRMLFQHYWKRDKGEIERAVNITHGLKFLEVEQLIKGINPFDIGKFEEAVRQYKFGEKRDYWQEVTLEKLDSAEKFFKEESTETGRGGIKGQDAAVEKVTDVLISAVADIQRRTGGNPARPKGVLFFAGPTGVGKTLMAQKLAIFLFGGEDKLLRFDMSEYKEEFQVTRLYGAPPGYVGYESGGTLTTKIKENPFSVILFDEIEKAHPRIFDIFLQILSDGRLTDSRGDTVYFAESILIFTSNLGMRATDSKGNQIDEKRKADELRTRLEECRENAKEAAKISELIKKHFTDCIENYFTTEISRPELFGRIGMDNVVVFDYITSEIARSILENQLSELCTRFNKYSQNETPSLKIEMNINQVTNALFTAHKEEIANLGARQAGNIIDAKIRSKLALEVLRAKAKNMSSGIIKIDVNNDGAIDVRLQ